MKLYEGMFLLDNQVVREDWGRAKAAVTETLAKHGAKVLTARHWDERKLAYSIKGRSRGTYVLAYFEGGSEAVNGMRRDLELDDRVLRYLLVRADVLPEGELEKSQAEGTAEFEPPTPPVEESLTPERAVFGELADRPVVDRSRSHSSSSAPSNDESESSESTETEASEESESADKSEES